MTAVNTIALCMVPEDLRLLKARQRFDPDKIFCATPLPA
jgi:hypothetical protein